VTGAAERTIRARKKYRTASKPFRIRLHACRDRAPRLGALDHDDAHLAPPLLDFFLSAACQFAIGRSALFSREALVPADPGGESDQELGNPLQHAGKTVLDWLCRLGRGLPGDVPKFPVLRGRGFDGLAAVRDGELQDLRCRLGAHEVAEKIESGTG